MTNQNDHEPRAADAALISDTPPASPGSRVARRIGVVLLAILVVVVAVLIGILAFVGAALAVPVAPVMFGALIVVGVAAAFGLSLLVFSRTRRRRTAGSFWRRTRVSQVCAAAAAVVLVGVTVLAYASPPVPPVAAPDDTQYVELATGSKLAYWEVPATEPSDESPVVFLHGGPGSGIGGTVPLLDPLAKEGFDLFYYDQVGAGFSSQLEADEYGMDRLIADLEAFRKEVVKSDKINIIGHSFGGYFAEAYAAAYPEAVDKVVLATPLSYENSYGTPTPEDEAEFAAAEPADFGVPDQTNPPFLAVVRVSLLGALAELSPAAAESYLPQAEQLRVDIAGGGLNFTAGAKIDTSANERVEQVLDKVKADALSTLILRSENDYILWTDLRAYRDINPNATMVYIPERTHIIFWEGSEETSPYEAVKTFLLDEPQAGEVYTGSGDPRLTLGDD
jgi:proline iminopeptidase